MKWLLSACSISLTYPGSMFRDSCTNSFRRVITARFLVFISSLIRKYLYRFCCNRYWSQLCFNTVSGNPNGPEHQTATNYFLQDRKFTGSFWRVQEFSEDIQSSVDIGVYKFADWRFEYTLVGIWTFTSLVITIKHLWFLLTDSQNIMDSVYLYTLEVSALPYTLTDWLYSP